MASNFYLNQQPWLPSAQGGAEGGGGGSPTTVDEYHDYLDAARSGAFGKGRTGDATYPDGYLGGDADSRRNEKLASAVSGRLTDRHFQRGVHAGVKMDRTQYFWPEECNPDAGILREMNARRNGSTLMVQRNGPVLSPVEQLVHGAQMENLTDPEKGTVYRHFGINPASTDWGPQEQVADPTLYAAMRGSLPPWEY